MSNIHSWDQTICIRGSVSSDSISKTVSFVLRLCGWTCQLSRSGWGNVQCVFRIESGSELLSTFCSCKPCREGGRERERLHSTVIQAKPEDRIRLQEAMKHPWIRAHCEGESRKRCLERYGGEPPHKRVPTAGSDAPSSGVER